MTQRKGEAEMSEVEWLIAAGGASPSVVTSGDIDAVVIQLFSLSHLWPRNTDEAFIHSVYVQLQKPRELYNITNIITHLEQHLGEKYIGNKIALALCMGGSDFIPKFYVIFHDEVLKMYVGTQEKYFLETQPTDYLICLSLG